MNRLHANIALLVAAAIWGSTFVVQQVAMDAVGPHTFTAARFFLGALVVAPLAYAEFKRYARRGSRISGKDWLFMVAAGCFLFLGSILQQIGIIYTTVTNASFLTALYVPLVPVLALVVLRRLPHWVTWPSAFGCLVGTYFLSGGDLAALNIGDLWVIASACFWAGHVLTVGFTVQKTGQPILLAGVQFTTCTLLATIAAFALEDPNWQGIMMTYQGILYAGIVSVGIGFSLQVVGQRHATPAAAAILLSMEAVFAAIAGAWFLGERLDAWGMAGVSLILFSVLAAELLPLLRRQAYVTR
ncbi:DMT family transporter [Aestuariispira insulae]|uniref:Drug/metabolite transporter (DMT)-like permease n=1 Tax=Aestuariispira insulae TaxID=1461337 RepID=A0A3D9HNZ9_9PROT|nr:DMT family transporter [Aestuariispira insulae]RED51224.1 drug/metabolite transporter (DMT)-like permease [Aestuariispira insulae]